MDNKQAITVIAQALELANKEGAFSLKDAELINGALQVMVALVQSVEPELKTVEPPTKGTKKVKA